MRYAFHVVLAGSLIALSSGTLHAQAPSASPLDRPKDRRHSHGPLAAADFLAQEPDFKTRGRGLLANTTTEIKYDFKYHLSKQRDKLHGRVESVEVFAVVLPAESWNSRPEDKALLDHEQGHFDLAQIHALRAQAELTRRFEDEPLEATGRKEIEVKQTLDREIRKLLVPFVEASTLANQEYDRLTLHGASAERQTQARKEQKEQLKKLAR